MLKKILNYINSVLHNSENVTNLLKLVLIAYIKFIDRKKFLIYLIFQLVICNVGETFLLHSCFGVHVGYVGTYNKLRKVFNSRYNNYFIKLVVFYALNNIYFHYF